MELQTRMPAKVIKVQADRPHQEFGSPRDVYLISLNDPEGNASRGYPNNYIRTTKYTLLTFLPKNLFEQFRRISNFYFLVVVIIQLIPQITPLIPVTSILPLLFVLVVTAIKEAVEDYYRHRADKKNNTEQFVVLRTNGVEEIVTSQDLRPGDIVKVKKDQTFPADLVVLSSSYEDGLCYVQTASLDGETNLKLRKALAATATYTTPHTLSLLRGAVQCETPNERLYQFNGRLALQLEDEKFIYSLDHVQLLQRGARLLNTSFVYGLVVYAGVDTKLFLNQQPPPSKFSTVERTLNRFILGIFLFQMLVCLANAVLSGWWEDSYAKDMYFLGENKYTTHVYALRNFFTYFVLFNTMIPISLWVTLEMVKVGQAKFMEWDDQMKVAKSSSSDNHMSAKTSNLNEDLGRIEHIFSDKTGTLTENVMKFSKCSVKGMIFDEKLYSGGLARVIKNPETPADTVNNVKDFLLVMALCHTSMPETKESTGEIVYQSQSPDETALVDTARDNGFVFINRKTDEIVLEIFGVEVTYKLLAILEFTSARRRMSVIVLTPQGKIMLLCKGADIVIYDRLVDGNDQLKESTLEDLKTFSKDGLRTLVFAQREISRQEYTEWNEIYHQAVTSIDNREERVEAACEIIENDLMLMGCTAIEDKLQDQVPETIHYLLEAGIQMWVLTGDKQETAINIGYSSRLLTPEMELIVINAENSEICGDVLKAALERHCFKHYNLEQGTITDMMLNNDGDDLRLLGMVIDGHSLVFALHDHTEAFLTLGKACRSVICCRVTPLQKALVVRVVKQGEQKISLAIGDGANDVSMIQEAHVGIGIYGKEGTQAARASDYAIHQFSHLRRLLCVHGRYSYMRVTGIIQYSFYKNMGFTLSMLYFSFFNGFTGQTLYDSWIITFYNIIFTSLPPLFYGLFEKDINEETIYKHPQVYQRIQRGSLFTKGTFTWWMLSAAWHSLVVFFGTLLLFQNNVTASDGRTTGLWTMGTCASTIAIVIVNLRMSLETKHWNIFTHLAIWGSIAAYYVTVILYNSVPGLDMANMYFEFFYLLKSVNFWLLMILLIVIALLPDFVAKYAARQYWPEDWQILREMCRKNNQVSPFRF